MRTLIPDTETTAKLLVGLGVIGALFPIALEVYIRIFGSIPAYWGDWAFQYVVFVLPVYVVALILRRVWAFYVACLILLLHFLPFLLFVVILQHVLYFVDPEFNSIPFWRFELKFLQFSWSWILSIILMFGGVLGDYKLLKMRDKESESGKGP
ncbi:MAG: hypothetical protein ACYS8Z_17580 [Planctomycetota bacterium]